MTDFDFYRALYWGLVDYGLAVLTIATSVITTLYIP
jgi:hypothetical protein